MNELTDASKIELSLMRKAFRSALPISGSLELLPLCNMDCQMCYVRLSRESADRLGGLRSLEEWISLADEMKKAGTLFLLLTGGEPLLYPDFQTLYQKLFKMGFILTINTNGTLLDEKWADFFAAHKPRRINITLYGKDDETYERLCHYKNGFTQALCALELLQKRNVDVKINYSAVSPNADDIDSVIRLARDRGIPINIDAYMYPVSRERQAFYPYGIRLSSADAAKVWYRNLRQSISDEEFYNYRSRILEAIEKRRHLPDSTPKEETACLAANCSFTINWQGKMRPCVMLSSPEISVFEEGFLTSWRTIHDKMKERKINAECIQCPLRPLCRICPASAVGECGFPEAKPDYLCQMTKETYALLLGDIIIDD